MEYSEDTESPWGSQRTTRLKEGIVLKELFEKFSSEFTLDASQVENNIESERESKIESVFDYNDFAPYINLDCINTGGEGDDDHCSPFENLKKKMIPITDDGKLLKVIIKPGSGDVIPQSCIVYYHYNSYLEMEEIPFDSSYLRNQKPVRMQVGMNSMYYGFEKSLLSMKVGEKSQFLVDPSYAFGKMGVPPRIPPNATILLEIELFKIVDCGAAIDTTDLPNEEREQFSECYKKAKAYHALGNDLFHQKHYSSALENYRKAESALLKSIMSSDEEEEKCKRLLLKIYVNMCVIYNNPKMKCPEKVCAIAKEAFLSCHKLAEESAKLYFCLAKAKMAFGDYTSAGRYFKQASKLEPHNKEINDAMADLEEKMKKHYSFEKMTCQKMFGFKPPEKSVDTPKPSLPVGFVNAFKQELEVFAANSSSRLQLPPGLTSQERKICKELTEEFGFTYEETLVCGKKSIAIYK